MSVRSEQQRRHYARHGDRRRTGALTTTSERIYTRLNTSVVDVANILLWQETHQARYSSIGAAMNQALRTLLDAIYEAEPDFVFFTDVDESAEYVSTYTNPQTRSGRQALTPRVPQMDTPFTTRDLENFADIDAMVARGTTTASATTATDDTPVSDDELAAMGPNLVRPYVSRLEPRPPDIAEARTESTT